MELSGEGAPHVASQAVRKPCEIHGCGKLRAWPPGGGRQGRGGQLARRDRRGATVLLTTHYLEEAQTLCDTIAIINHGRLIACEPTDDMVRRLDTKEMTITVDRDLEDVPKGLNDYPVELLDERRLKFAFPPSKINSGDILSAVQAAGLKIVDVTTREAELEDIFLKLTGPPAPGEP